MPLHVFVLDGLPWSDQFGIGVVSHIGNQRRLFRYSTVVMILRLEMSMKSFGL